MVAEVLTLITFFIFGIIAVISAFLFTTGLLLERQILCFFFKWHKYESPASHNDDYHEQAQFCEHCNKIKWS
jgi:hypothetical protein